MYGEPTLPYMTDGSGTVTSGSSSSNGYTMQDYVDSQTSPSLMERTIEGNRLLAKLSNLKVNSSKKVKELVNTFYSAGRNLYGNFENDYNVTYRPKQDALIGTDFNNFPDPKKNIAKIASLFQTMKNYAVSKNYTELADAVTDSAVWFWENIEKPAQPSSSPQKYASSPNSLDRAKKKARRAKFIQWGVISLSLAIGGTMIYYAFFAPPKSKSKPKSNPRKRVVTKGRVRKRNRKSIPKVRRNRKPIIPSKGSHLSNYRKKYESSKKRKGLRLKK